jgi:ABC-type cobalamin/Fe3+-siderophores transport system ATPase subunit
LLSPSERYAVEVNARSADQSPSARWSEDYSAQRASIAIYDLIDAENIRARSISGAVDAGDFALAKARSTSKSAIGKINELLRLSSLRIELSIHENAQLVASGNDGQPYSVAELSDGERNAILIAATVLTVNSGTLLLLDEPERHLHRSIVSPLLRLLFSERKDCTFVVSTHEVSLPADYPGSRTVLLRSCKYSSSGGRAVGWEADVLLPDAEIGDDLKKDMLGARQRILFVEGAEQSLDKPLYSLVFPEVSVVAKASCRDVENAVAGLRGAAQLHWVRAFGLVDNDRRPADVLTALKVRGVYALPVVSVEAIYYHTEIQRRVAEAHASVTGENAARLLADARSAALTALTPHKQRLSERVAEREAREQVFRNAPTKADMSSQTRKEIVVDIPALVAAETKRFADLVSADDLDGLIAGYPVRDTPALYQVAKGLGFQDREQYERAVRTLLMQDSAALSVVRSLFGTLHADLSA